MIAITIIAVYPFATKIINIVINRLFDLKNGYTSDYTDYAHEDILSLADGLEQICNPYANTQLYDYLSTILCGKC